MWPDLEAKYIEINVFKYPEQNSEVNVLLTQCILHVFIHTLVHNISQGFQGKIKSLEQSEIANIQLTNIASFSVTKIFYIYD